MLTAWLLFGVSLALIALCGLFVAAEFSFVTVSRTAVQCAADNGVPGAAGLGEALRSLSTQLSAAQVGITITNLLIGWVAEPSIATLLRDPMLAFGTPESAVRGISLTVALIVSTVLTMLFGELLPQNLALAHPFGVGRVVQAPQRWFTAVSRPLTLALNDLSNRIVHALGVEPQEELASARSPEELVSVVRASARSGHLAPGTADLVERSLRFDDLQAKDVLTPRTRMVWLEATDPVQRAIELGVRHGRSRFPVAGEDLDDI
ncbi:MAG TPA: CNNM domain-containing protein, partial [Actinopolymorphaceae bacterium]